MVLSDKEYEKLRYILDNQIQKTTMSRFYKDIIDIEYASLITKENGTKHIQ